jgi:hypothetical protein
MAPLLTPAPGLGRSLRPEPPVAGVPAAGEIAASPVGVFAPVLAFCASARELVNTSATAAITACFMARFPFMTFSSVPPTIAASTCWISQVGITP